MRRAVSKILLAALVLNIFGLIGYPSQSTEEVQQTWVRMHGGIVSWDSTPVIGIIVAHARMVDTPNNTYREWAKVNAIWTLSPRHINCTDPPTENFTYSFYSASLINESIIELDYLGYDFYIEGQWNVYNVSISYTVEGGNLIEFYCNKTIVAEDTSGKLAVSGSTFELDIADLGTLVGVVRIYIVGHMEIKICDVNGNAAVNIEDLVKVAKRYGAMPGLGNYSAEMDFNYDFKIDIGDLTTLAANIDS